jgi:hypothetical protein
MSRKPIEQTLAINWHSIGDDFPRQKTLLTTIKPSSDLEGVPAVWYSRRRNEGGRWVTFADWVDPLTRESLDPQPTHWRPDPMQGKFPKPPDELAEAS